MWIISCKIIQSILGMLVNMISARYLGPSDYGLINYATAITSFVLPIVQLGFRATLVNEIIENPHFEGEIIGTTLFFSAISSIVSIVGLGGFVYSVNPDEPKTVIVCILYSMSLLAQALEMICYWYQAKMIAQYTALTGLVAYVITTVYKIYLLVTGKNVYWFAVSQALDYLVIAIVLIVLYFKLDNQRLRVSFKRFKQMFKKSKFFIVSSLMVTFFSQTDKIMLKRMVSDQAVGVYSAATACAGLTSFVFSAIIDSFRPMILENKKISQKMYEKSLILCYSVTIYSSLAQSVFITIFSKLIIAVLYGANYAASASVLRLVVWYTTFSYIGSIRNIWILAENKHKYLWVINASGALTNIVLNRILIPYMEVMGAALASLIAQVFTNVIVSYIVKPIRDNNRLLFWGCDLSLLISYFKRFIKLRKRGHTDV